MDRSAEPRLLPQGPVRRRTMCVLEAGEDAPAAVRSVTAYGAFLETNARPRLGTAVRLRHPLAGTIAAEVSGISADGISLVFPRDAASTGFALGVIASGMIDPLA